MKQSKHSSFLTRLLHRLPSWIRIRNEGYRWDNIRRSTQERLSYIMMVPKTRMHSPVQIRTILGRRTNNLRGRLRLRALFQTIGLPDVQEGNWEIFWVSWGERRDYYLSFKKLLPNGIIRYAWADEQVSFEELMSSYTKLLILLYYTNSEGQFNFLL